ncbi:hypothetical protein MTR67_041741 [Solanum verrucosum]|nr:hypothetical protein MTR67_041741 [Solanum verrucosum]
MSVRMRVRLGTSNGL